MNNASLKKIRPELLISRALIYLVLIAVTIYALFPVVYIIFGSFKTNREILVGGVNIFPKEWQTENYVRAWKSANFSRFTLNSLFMCVFIVAGSVITSSMEGYIFAKGKTKLAKIANGIVTASLFVSIGALSLYPQVRLIRFFGLNGTLWGVILIHIFGLNVTQVILSTSYFRQIPKELSEAARIDGCGFFKTFVLIMFPLIKPLIATIGLISFRNAWSDYLLPFVMTIARPMRIPLVVAVVNLKSNGATAGAWDLMLAGISISLVPMLVIYIFLNRFMIAGLTEGAVKG
jgi:multiple sugar transport system permease protein